MRLSWLAILLVFSVMAATVTFCSFLFARSGLDAKPLSKCTAAQAGAEEGHNAEVQC